MDVLAVIGPSFCRCGEPLALKNRTGLCRRCYKQIYMLGYRQGVLHRQRPRAQVVVLLPGQLSANPPKWILPIAMRICLGCQVKFPARHESQIYCSLWCWPHPNPYQLHEPLTPDSPHRALR